jgi:hypothetical protein
MPALLVLSAACQAAPSPTAAIVAATAAAPGLTSTTQFGYPGPGAQTQSYPGPTLVNSQQTPVPPTDLPTPPAGQGTVAGVLYSFTIHAIVQQTLIYLTPAVGADHKAIPNTITGPSDTPGSVRGQTNDLAQFVLANVPPGNYYLVVASPLTWNLGASASSETTPMLITVAANQTVSLGVVHVSWP